ncbi:MULTISPECIES: T9SS type A sorting domain-containing protein [unclassified Flavobacterium]|uniref:T9SS type A sorting domain-containing protein n=1 Tax=unclassified Flavobacterium TaxID=196869 RepID=UPI0009379FB0
MESKLLFKTFPFPVLSHITLFDINRRKLNTITNKTYDAGRIDIPYNCSSLISGVYFLRIEAGSAIVNKTFIKKLSILFKI